MGAFRAPGNNEIKMRFIHKLKGTRCESLLSFQYTERINILLVMNHFDVQMRLLGAFNVSCIADCADS